MTRVKKPDKLRRILKFFRLESLEGHAADCLRMPGPPGLHHFLRPMGTVDRVEQKMKALAL